MRVIHGYFSWIAFLAMFLAIWAPVVQIGAEIYHWYQTDTVANYDLYSLFPTESAAVIADYSGGVLGIALDLLCDVWVWVPAVLVLSAIGIAHWIIAGLTRR